MSMTKLTLALTAGALVATHASAVVVGSTIEDVSSQFNNTFADASNTVNSNGLDTTNPDPFQWTHDNGLLNGGGGSGFFWHDASNQSPDDASITFNLGSIVDVNSVLVWNFNVTFDNGGVPTAETDRGFNQYDLFVSADNVNFTQIVTDGFLNQAGGTNAEGVQVINVAGLANGVQYVRIEADTNHGSTSHTGLSEVRFDVVPEPGSLALLGLGGLALLRRRR